MKKLLLITFVALVSCKEHNKISTYDSLNLSRNAMIESIIREAKSDSICIQVEKPIKDTIFIHDTVYGYVDTCRTKISFFNNIKGLDVIIEGDERICRLDSLCVNVIR